MRRAIWCVAALALFAAGAVAQSTSQLNGSVMDPSGAAVPNATITLTAAATGLQRTTTSNSRGLYQFLDVPPGTYKLDASAQGFVAFSESNVVLVVNTPSTVNVHLSLTSVATKVTVEGEGAPLINRTDASLGNTLEENQISELPIADRNVVQLLSLQPGVAYLGNNLDQDTDTRSGAVNGIRSDQSNVTLDDIGMNDQNNGYAFTSVLTVPPDSVEEFRVTTADSNADSGYSSGAQVSLVTKSGTNNFHGSVYEYNRNTIFSANDPFLKASQLGNGEPNQAPKLLRNVFGATGGGPIRKNRAFFFLNYEGRRDAQGSSVLRTVPTATLRDGILEYQCADAGACPGGSVMGNSENMYTVAPGNYALDTAQITAMDPLGIGPSTGVEHVLGKYPNVNDPGYGDTLNTAGYRFSSNADSSFNTYIARMDWHITSSGSENLFWRGETENIKQPQAQEFPGQTAASTLLDDSKGSTVGLTSILSPNLINDFHWGFIRQGGQSAGASFYPGVFLNDVDDLVPFTRSSIYFVPVNQFSDSLNWTKGNHTLQFGGDFFVIRNDRTSYQNSFSDIQTNVVYLNTSGISITGTSQANPNPLNPVNHGYPAVDQGFAPNYDSATEMLMGIFAEGDGVYNFDRAGNALAQGTPINRRYAINDYEFYGQDAWRITPRLTVTYGLRWVLEAPPYETNGLQVSPCVQNPTTLGCTNQNVADWFNHTAQLAAAGMPANDAGEISFNLGGPANNGPGLWNWDHKDFSPRVAVAWSPDTGDGLLSKILGPKDKFSIRGGYSIMYDHFGIPIVNSFDQHGSFGLSSDIGNPAGVVSVSNAPRFTCLTPGPTQAANACLPAPCPDLNNPGCLFGPTPTGGFPVTPSNSAFAINWGLDQTLKTPYSHVFNLTLSREVGPNSSLQISYVGSIGRRLPMQVDLAMPANLTDPASHTTYFQAAKMMSQEAVSGVPTSQVQPVPFFEHLFPQWSTVTQNQLNNDGANCAPDVDTGALTATQAIYDLWSCYVHNETFSLFLLDVPNDITGLDTPNGVNGPYMFFHDQFSSLYAWRNIGTSDYNGLQVTYNVHWGTNLQGQFNYTFSKSLDEASSAERIGPYEGSGGTGNDSNGGGIVINSWDPLSLRGLSDFNAKHQFNSNLVYALPLGRGQMLDGNAGGLLNAIIGGWHVSGILRWTSGFPTTVDNSSAWPTNWNIEGDAMPNGPSPKTANAIINVNGTVEPDIFADPSTAATAFRRPWPGESGVRNNVIADGLFNLDTGLAKDFAIGERAKAEFSWQTFNITNSVSYNSRTNDPAIGQATFGLYTSTLTTPRFMQFALRFSF